MSLHFLPQIVQLKPFSFGTFMTYCLMCAYGLQYVLSSNTCLCTFCHKLCN